MASSKINKIVKYAKFAPVIVCGIPKDVFEGAVIIDANIPSKELGIVNSLKGLKYPEWYLKLKKNDIKILVINLIDSIPCEEQEKFYEILKYKEITNTALPEKTRVIVLANDIEKVADSIRRLCLIY